MLNNIIGELTFLFCQFCRRVPSDAKQNFTTDAQTESKSTLQINNEAATDRPKNGAKITGGPANQVQGK